MSSKNDKVCDKRIPFCVRRVFGEEVAAVCGSEQTLTDKTQPDCREQAVDGSRAAAEQNPRKRDQLDYDSWCTSAGSKYLGNKF